MGKIILIILSMLFGIGLLLAIYYNIFKNK